MGKLPCYFTEIWVATLELGPEVEEKPDLGQIWRSLVALDILAPKISALDILTPMISALDILSPMISALRNAQCACPP